MTRRILLFTLFAGLALTMFFSRHTGVPPTFGLPNFTTITRTPTPPPPTSPPPTSPPPGATSKPSDPQPTTPPQATDIPTHTPTATLIPVTLAATPAGGYLPTAVACGVPPTVQTRNTVNVRSGPGVDYDIIGQLVYLEVRPILGRAADAEWWVIQLTNETIGWVANAAVIVHGNISGLPIVGAEPLEGKTPTPSPLWNPTRNPSCPVIPTATAQPTNTSQPATATREIMAEAEATATPTAKPTSTPTAEPTTETEPPATATSMVPEGEATTVAAANVVESDQPTAVPLAEPETSAVAALPCASAVIGLAMIGFLAFRRIF
ncbi:MAG: SH3 domain-containing protein [Chloroflexota bacterium]